MTLRLAVLYPELLTACGDMANATALVARAEQRGYAATVVVAQGSEPLPDADLYLVGGMGALGRVGALATRLLDGGLAERVADGARVFAVNAGLDALGQGVVSRADAAVQALATPELPEGVRLLAPGVGLFSGLSVECREHGGEAVVRPRTGSLGTVYNGWVAQRMHLFLSSHTRPWSTYELGPHGVGDTWLGNTDLLIDGVCTDAVLGTRLHGPVLGRNPECADAVLALALHQSVTDFEDLPPGPAHRGRDARVRELRAAQQAELSLRGKVRGAAGRWSSSTVGWMRRR